MDTSLLSNGVVRNSTDYAYVVQTAMAANSLGEMEDLDGSRYTLHRAIRYLASRARTDAVGGRYWKPDDQTDGWWSHQQPIAAFAMRGIARLAEDFRENGDFQYSVVSLDQVNYLGVGSRFWDLAYNPDNRLLYMTHNHGHIYSYDREKRDWRIEFRNVGNDPLALAVRADGGFYVSTNDGLKLITPDGTRRTLVPDRFRGLAAAPQGGVYGADPAGRRIVHVDDDGRLTVIASGGAVSNAFDVIVDDDGSLVVANGNAMNLLRISTEGDISLIAEGLAARPYRVARYGDGYLVAGLRAHWNRDAIDKLMYVSSDGRAHSVGTYEGMTGIAITDTGIYSVATTDTGIDKLAWETGMVSSSTLSSLESLATGVARHVLFEGDNTEPELIIHAARLATLTDAIPLITDETLRGRAELLASRIADSLRASQRPDGGWPVRWSAQASDSLVTAYVGLALQRLNAPANDAAIRSAVEFLLSTQGPDGSWRSESGIMDTRLSATGLVMAFMPKALARISAIDVSVNLVAADDVAYGNFSRPPATEFMADGREHHTWQIDNLGAGVEAIAFDVMIDGMRLGEHREIAGEAWLEFHNAFNGDTVRMDIGIPAIKAVSGMAIAVTTDSSEYGDQAPLVISGNVHNLTSLPQSAVAELSVHAAGSETPLASIGTVPLDAISGNSSIPFTAEWNTGSTLPGELEIVATLFNSAGEVADVAVAPFAIVRPASAVAAGITTDKPVYGGFDVVHL
ncbi:MAG TPA: prenyltransferase/squalene oxidase repeat-containing protein, partial [Gammaproteobacteria bacterium]